MHGECHPRAGTRGGRGGDAHRGYPQLPGVGVDPPLAIMPVRVRILCDIVMAEHGVESSPRGLPSAPCAHTFSWLWVAHLYTCRTVRSGHGGARCPSYLSTVLADALLSHRFAPMT
jgi:hypothetical protein